MFRRRIFACVFLGLPLAMMAITPQNPNWQTPSGAAEWVQLGECVALWEGCAYGGFDPRELNIISNFPSCLRFGAY